MVWARLAEQHGAPKGLTIGQAIAYLDRQPAVGIRLRLDTTPLPDAAMLCYRYGNTPGVLEVLCPRSELVEALRCPEGEWLFRRGILYVEMD